MLFLAQFYGVDAHAARSRSRWCCICILGGIGTAGVPAGSIPVVAMILGMVGVPAEGIGMILGVDRFLDMCRTTLNVTGDLVPDRAVTWLLLLRALRAGACFCSAIHPTRRPPRPGLARPARSQHAGRPRRHPCVSTAGLLGAAASCGDGEQISFTWSWIEDPAAPDRAPRMGRLRRPAAHARRLRCIHASEPRALPSHARRQRELHVHGGPARDGDDVPVPRGARGREPPGRAHRPAGVGSRLQHRWLDQLPGLLGPLTQGTLIDQGWALFLTPCPGSCHRCATTAAR